MADIRSAAFRTQPFPVTVRGVEFQFPSVPASQWLDAFSHPTFHLIVFRMMDAEQTGVFLDALDSGRLDVEDYEKLANAALTEASGRPWWETWKLMSAVVNQESGGRLLGTLVLEGVDASSITLAAWCAAVWALLTRNADTAQLMKLEMQISMPPPGVEDDEWDNDDFDAVAARMRSIPGARVG